MAATYSIAQYGIAAAQEFGPKVELLPDDVVPPGQTYTLSVASPGGMRYCMQRNIPFLAKDASGQQYWAVLDAERSTPTSPILKRV